MEHDNRRQDISPTVKFYNLLAPIYARFRDFGHQRDADLKGRLIDYISPLSKDVVLDVGTGPGVYALDIAKAAPDSRVVGIDITEAFISIAKGRAQNTHIENIEFAVGNIEQLNFEDAFFTKVICAGVISVIKKKKQAINELARVLKPGGKLAMREPKRSDGSFSGFIYNLPEKSKLRKMSGRTGLMFGHFSPEFLSEKEIKDLFAGSSFSKLDIQSHGGDLFILATK